MFRETKDFFYFVDQFHSLKVSLRAYIETSAACDDSKSRIHNFLIFTAIEVTKTALSVIGYGSGFSYGLFERERGANTGLLSASGNIGGIGGW